MLGDACANEIADARSPQVVKKQIGQPSGLAAICSGGLDALDWFALVREQVFLVARRSFDHPRQIGCEGDGSALAVLGFSWLQSDDAGWQIDVAPFQSQNLTSAAARYTGGGTCVVPPANQQQSVLEATFERLPASDVSGVSTTGTVSVQVEEGAYVTFPSIPMNASCVGLDLLQAPSLCAASYPGTGTIGTFTVNVPGGGTVQLEPTTVMA